MLRYISQNDFKSEHDIFNSTEQMTQKTQKKDFNSLESTFEDMIIISLNLPLHDLTKYHDTLYKYRFAKALR